MPTYQYRCKECGHDFEIVQAFTDDALTKCPECKKAALKKVYGNVGISFKGSGFYKNDARSSSSSSKPSTSESGSDSSAKSDAKADKKSDTKKPDSKKSDSSSGSKGTATKSTSESSSG